MEATKHTDIPFPAGNVVFGKTTLNQTAGKVAGAAGQYVSAHPWKSLGIAFTAGFLISRLLRSGQMSCSMWMAGGCVREPVQPGTQPPY